MSDKKTLTDAINDLTQLLRESEYHSQVLQAAVDGCTGAVEDMLEELPKGEGSEATVDVGQIATFAYRVAMGAEATAEVLHGVSVRARELTELLRPNSGDSKN